MESIIQFITENVHLAHLMIFFLLMLAGLNVPMSEDLLVLTGGYLAGRYAPESVFLWYSIIFAGCWLSAWECYWLGRLFGPKLYQIPWFKRWINPQLIAKIHTYYEKYGIFTFLVGRFIPGGVRNALFLSSGLGKMPFSTFIFRDGLGCLLSCSTLFIIGFSFAENTDFLLNFNRSYHLVTVGVVAVLAAIALYFFLNRKKNNSGQ
jgi:membrane-associated protein